MMLKLDTALNALKYIAIAAVVLGIFYYFYVVQQKMVELTSSTIRWEQNYHLAAKTAEDNLNTVLKMASLQYNLMEDLKEWRNTQVAIEKQLSANKKRIQMLERENENVRAVLSTAIPCELWEQIFPDTPKCPRKD